MKAEESRQKAFDFQACFTFLIIIAKIASRSAVSLRDCTDNDIEYAVLLSIDRIPNVKIESFAPAGRTGAFGFQGMGVYYRTGRL